MNDKIQGSDAPVSARRRLLRGTFAAPTVLTLYSGGALAQASANLRCVVNQNQPGTAITSGPTIVVDTSNSTYLRVALRETSSPTTKNWILGSDLPANRSSPPTLPSNTQYYAFDAVANTIATGPSIPPPTPVVVAKYAVLRVDATGKVVGVGAGIGGSAIGKSCWTSAML